MSSYDHALRLAARGFHVFALVGDSKLPLIEDFPNRATTEKATLTSWFFDDVMGFPQHCNIGISTSRFATDEALIVVDVDDKNDKKGSVELAKLEMLGFDLPETFTQTTPTGGRHLVFRHEHAVKQGVDVLGKGLDIRSHGGYIVGSGSYLEGKGGYTDNGKPVAQAPAWLIEKCGKVIERAADANAPASVDEERALARFEEWLKTAPRSVKGDGGDQCAYTIACKGRDYGVSEADCLDAMMGPNWDDGCGWDTDRLAVKIRNAYRYAKEVAGNKAPEVEFEPLKIPAAAPTVAKTAGAKTDAAAAPKTEQREKVPLPLYDSNHPVNKFNRDHAFVIMGGSHYVLWETTDYKGQQDLRYLEESTFHRIHTAVKFPVEKKDKVEYVSATKVWMDSPARETPPKGDDGDAALWRRSYRGVVFDPSNNAPAGYYNVWRGFAYAPWPRDQEPPRDAQWALDAWKEHLHLNICRGDEKLARWLTGWFAHAVQKPGEKPLVAVVMHGDKGVGKTTVAERFCALLGGHGLITRDRRFLTSNFNGHMERLLCLVLDEAMWPGDKAGEGVLKGLITSPEHLIERKGKEPYRVDNYTRVIIIGNERWLVPATHDERRFAVFNVGDGRKQQNEWFEKMRRQMESGGYAILLRYLLDFDLKTVDVNRAPNTEGLLAQKEESLEPLAQWWQESLLDGRIAQSDTPHPGWPPEIACDEIPRAVNRYFRGRNINGRLPSAVGIGRDLRKFCPSLARTRRADGQYVYRIPELHVARNEWDTHMGHPVSWN